LPSPSLPAESKDVFTASLMGHVTQHTPKCFQMRIQTAELALAPAGALSSSRMCDDSELDALAQRMRSFPLPPRDWRDAAGWEVYWSATIPDRKRLAARVFTAMTLTWIRLVDSLRERGRKRLLFIGNGLSIAPWAFAHAGYECVAFDLAPSVARFFRENAITEEWVRRAYVFPERHAEGAFERARRPGGSVQVVCGDLFDPCVAPGPFDAIFSEASLQGFSESDLARAVSAIVDRLHQRAECHVLVRNSKEALTRIVALFVALGFHDAGLRTGAIPRVDRLIFSGLGSG